MKKILLALSLLFHFAASAQRTGHNYAVFFYVTDFQPGWARLPETKPEALALKTELEANFGFQCEAVANPTKDQILAKLKSYNDRLTANDQLMLFFSMHGHYEESAERGYLIAANGALNDDYGTTWLSYDDLSAYLARCRAKHVLLALDACHSGSFGIRNRPRPDAAAYAQTDDCAQRVTKMFQYTGRQYCSSGNKESKTPAKSLFASRFLEALRKGGEEGLLRFDDLEYFLGKVENPRPESGTFKGHEPGGDFVFVRKGGCAAQSDGDGDNIPDASDQCPDQWGSQANGCPPESTNTSDVAADLAAWKEAKRLHTETAYRAYLHQYPNGEFKEQANAALLMSDGMVFIKGGKFQMGSSIAGADRGDDEQQHEVELSDFYIGKYEVTQKQWRDVMGSDPTELYFKNCDNCPVERVSWNDIQDFIKKLNQQTGRIYRLPTEAEWEYAARGGGKAVLFGNGKNIADPKEINFDSRADYKKSYSVTGEYRQKTVPVGSLNSPNALGLHDMSGNVWEWCSDWYDANYYKSSPSKNPTGPSNGSDRVFRGGSWTDYPQYCRAAYRDGNVPGDRDGCFGFRLARTN